MEIEVEDIKEKDFSKNGKINLMLQSNIPIYIQSVLMDSYLYIILIGIMILLFPINIIFYVVYVIFLMGMSLSYAYWKYRDVLYFENYSGTNSLEFKNRKQYLERKKEMEKDINFFE